MQIGREQVPKPSLISQRATTFSVAEMYVLGVSTRKVTAVVQEFCGRDITSTQVYFHEHL